MEITRVYLSCLKGVENVDVSFLFGYIHFVRLPYYFLRTKWLKHLDTIFTSAFLTLLHSNKERMCWRSKERNYNTCNCDSRAGVTT